MAAAPERRPEADAAAQSPALADVSLPFGMAYLLRRLHRVFARRLEAEHRAVIAIAAGDVGGGVALQMQATGRHG